jgi:hypothetical protein
VASGVAAEKNLPANHAKGREKDPDFFNLAFFSRGSRAMFRFLFLFFIAVHDGN